MRGVLLREIGLVEIAELDDPTPSKSEVVVEVQAAGICGSDVHSARDGGLLRTPPLVMGHEFSGTYENRRVAVNPMIVCYECPRCVAGETNLCENRRIIGIQRAGGLASRVAVPQSCLVDLPDDVSIEAGAMVEPLAVALHAVKLSRVERVDTVGILGAGTIGLMIAYLCSGQVDQISVADPSRRRRDIAESIGVTSTSEELSGVFDVVFDAVGSSTTHRLALEHLKPGGTTIWVGNEDPDPGFDAQMLVRIEQRILGSAAYTVEDFAEAATKVSDGLLEWAEVRPIEEAPEIIYSLMQPGSEGPVKFIFRP